MGPNIKKIFKKIIEWAAYAAIFIIIVWGTPQVLSYFLQTEYPIASITSGSMWPVLKVGDLVLIHGINGKEDLKIGDIIVYRNQAASLGPENSFIIHRIVKLGDTIVITKGDANNIEDPPVAYDQVIGKAVMLGDKPLRVPWLGNLSIMFNKSKS